MVIATETPVPVFDFERMEVVEEVIRMDGVEIPKQIPLLDSHERHSVQHVLGSVRDIQVDGTRLVGRAYFASNPDAVRVYETYREGHLTDVSVGAQALAVEWQGDRKIVTRSKPYEVSAVAVGADPNAKAELAVRAYIEPEIVRDEIVYEELRREFDVPADVADADVIGWVKRKQEEERKAAAAAAAPQTPAPAEENNEDAGDGVTERAARDIAKDVLRRVNAIDDICRQHSIDDKQRADFINSDMSVEQVSHQVLATLQDRSATPEGTGVEFTASEHDKWAQAVGDGLVTRAIDGRFNVDTLKQRAAATRQAGLQNCVAEIDRAFNKPATGAADFRYASFTDIARSFLSLHNRRTQGMPAQEIIREAIRFSNTIERDGAYHSTGSFTNLMLDASNKTLLSAYVEAPSTWEMWARRAAPAADFKNLNRIRFGELPNPDMVPENGTYPDKSVSDAKESYSVDKYGEIFSITLEAMINDDLDALSRIPAMHGAAMRRKVNQSVYAILTDNPDLSDSVALFNASHSNTDSNTLSTSSLNTGFTKMAVQTGLSSSAILNLRPSYLIVPPALEADALTITRSMADPTSTSNTADFNEGTQNLYGPNGPRRLMVVSDAYLSSSLSATTWFLAADSGQVDTVEVSFLQGEETPVLAREDGFDVDAIKFKCRQTWGVAPIDYRGLYRGNS